MKFEINIKLPKVLTELEIELGDIRLLDNTVVLNPSKATIDLKSLSRDQAEEYAEQVKLSILNTYKGLK